MGGIHEEITRRSIAPIDLPPLWSAATRRLPEDGLLGVLGQHAVGHPDVLRGMDHLATEGEQEVAVSIPKARFQAGTGDRHPGGPLMSE